MHVVEEGDSRKDTLRVLKRYIARETFALIRTGPLRTLIDVETLTMNYVHWYGNERLHSQLNNVAPEEYEQAYYASTTGSPSGDAASKKTA